MAPHRVRLAVNAHHWDNISFLHWPFPPEDIAPLVPDQLRVLTFDGAAWVGVTPFFIRVRPLAVPVVLPRCAFPETNVRTYVTNRDGAEGLWFLRMEVTAAWFVATLRAFGLPYFRQRMSVDVGADRIRYRSRPAREHGYHFVVRPGAPLEPAFGVARDRFLTARWAAYHRVGPALLYTRVEHAPWPLQTATVETCDVGELFGQLGLPAPSGPPVAHFSPGVSVKVGVPRVVT